MRRSFLTVALFCSLIVPSGSSAEEREITGTLVEPKTRLPIAGQTLVLDRATGDYSHIPFAMLIVGTPQPASIEAAVSDSRGHFRFVTTKDRGRFLEVRISGRSPADFRSTHGYAVEHLHDSLHPGKPLVDFDATIIHNPRGGFMSVP